MNDKIRPSRRNAFLIALLIVLIPLGAFAIWRTQESGKKARAENAARLAAGVAALNAQGKIREARDVARQWTDLQTDNPDAWRELGVAAAAQGDFTAAKMALQKAVALNPEDGAAQLTLGGLYFAQKEYVASETACRAALKRDPKNVQASLGLARALLAQNKFRDEAETAARNALNGQSGVALVRFTLSDALLKRGDRAGATEALTEARRGLALDPSNTVGYDLMATASRVLGDAAAERRASETAKAIREYRPGAEMPDPIRLARGEAQLEGGRNNEALAEFLPVLRRDIANAGALEGAGLAVWQLGDRATASGYLAEALRHDPDRVRARLALGVSSFESGLYGGAQRHFLRVTEIQPDNAPAWRYLGQTYVARQLHEAEAEAALRHAVALDSGNPQYLMDFADILKTNNKWQEAEKSYRQALALTPDSAEVTGRFGAFLSQAPLDAAKRAEAKTLLEKSLRLAPDEPFNEFNLGRLLVDEEKYAEAVPQLEAATKFGQGRTKDVWSLLGRAYGRLGKTDKAAAALAAADKIQRESDAYDRAVERLSSDLNNPAFRLEMARASVVRGEATRALAEYDSYLRRKPDDAMIKKERAEYAASLKAAGKYPDMTLYNRLNVSAK